MALIICPECSREISDRAASCPHCGLPNPAAGPTAPSEVIHAHDDEVEATTERTNGLENAASEKVEATSRPRKRLPAWVRHWIVAFVVINGSTKVIDSLLDKESRQHLRTANCSFMKSVKQVDPFRLAKVYFAYVWYNDSPIRVDLKRPDILDSLKPKVRWDTPEGLKTVTAENIASMDRMNAQLTVSARMARAVVGLYFVVIWVCGTGGAVSIVMTALALILALLIVTARGNKVYKGDPTDSSISLYIFLVPFIASIIAWAFVHALQVCGALFGGMLAGAQILATINATVFGLFWKVGEHHASTKVIDQLAGAHPSSSHGDISPHG